MPYPGDQHQSNRGRYNGNGSNTSSWNNSTPNVFGTPFNDKEAGHIRQELNRQLGPEYISHRPGGGGLRVPYLEGWKVINLANEIFGFNGWNSEIKAHEVDYCDEVKDGKFNLGMSVKIRVTLRDGTYREDIGYGQVENARNKGIAFDKCKKEATTDALKRALRLFGNALGNCLYDSTYTRNITRVKGAMPPFDENQLIRRPEIKAMQEAAALKAAEEAVKREVVNSSVLTSKTPNSTSASGIASSTTSSVTPKASISSTKVTQTLPSTIPANGPSRSVEPDHPSLGFLSDDFLDDYEMAEIDGLPYISNGRNSASTPAGKDLVQPGNSTSNVSSKQESPKNPPQVSEVPKPSSLSQKENEGPAKFLSAKAVLGGQTSDGGQFDPTFESPSLRRTVANKSVPISRRVASPSPQIRTDGKLSSGLNGSPSELESRKRPRIEK